MFNFPVHLSGSLLSGGQLLEWVIALAAALVCFGVISIVLHWLLGRVSDVARRTSTAVDDVLVDVLQSTNRWLLVALSALVGLAWLELPARWEERVGQLWFVVIALQCALWVSRIVTLVLRRHGKQPSGPDAAGGSSLPVSASATLLSWGLRSVLWSIFVLAVLSNFGIDITAFVASLGVGGIAVALAVQNILGDLFASLAIALDKPFEVGDAIAVSGISGSVEHVGLKTTRIRGLGGEQIVMSNAELLKNTVSNYKRQTHRRVVVSFGVSYATTPEQAASVPAIVERLVGSTHQLRFDRAHLMSLSESSLDYEVVYVVLDPSYQLHMDLQQRLLIDLMRELASIGVAFAHPARSVVLVRDGGS